MKKIVMYRTRACPFCVAAERLLRHKGAEFDEVYLDDHPDRRSFTAEILPGHRSVPLIVIDEEPIGGFDTLRELDMRGALDLALGVG